MNNSTEQTVDRLISQGVYVNASQMIDELTRIDTTYLDDLLPCLSAPDYSEAPDGYLIKHDGMFGEWNVFRDDELGTSVASNLKTEREAIIAAWEDSGKEPDDIEAFQHWIVSDYLADALEEVGALVVHDLLGFHIWGRTECGQSLAYDGDLNRAAALINSRLAAALAS